MTGSAEILDNQPSEKFLCGVVEGFYGIPWTTEQRKLLFQWMNSMGMTTYMYAPKDDAKHRAFWRDLYSVEEADNLTGLIEAAADCNVTFVYAISPGLDISFSSSKDVQCLKRKLEQVSAFGCHSFALLFDDIDPELSVSDKSAFQSSACAQVSVTNEVFEHLGQPEFYFCPTEYCTSRAMPNLSSSGYLNTVGSKLLNDIHILWTGSKVISKKIVIKELEDVAKVLRRPPVIWDNIHANDYDPRRIFLGPYDGRSTEIIPYLRGVLTNPNCEFEANYIPLHTLGQWSQSNRNAVKKDIVADCRLSPVVSDIKLECDDVTDEDITCFDSKYQPKQALKIAITDWLLEFNKPRHPPKSVAVATASIAPTPTGPAPNLNMQNPMQSYNELATTTIPTTTVNPVEASFMNPASSVLVNSLVDPLCSPENSPPRHRLDSDTDSDISLSPEPMDCVPSAIADSLNALENDADLTKDLSSDTFMQVENPPYHLCESKESQKTYLEPEVTSLISYDDIDLLIQFFYLPFEYATKPSQLLQDFHWLKTNCFLVSKTSKENAMQATEWWEVSNRFLRTVAHLQDIINVLKKIPNLAVGFYLYPYLWDMMGVIQTCAGFIRWLGLGHIPSPVLAQQQTYTWMTKEYRDTFLSGDQEPWCFQGGLQAEFQRMLPISTAYDLLYIRHPEKILKKSYSYRPYKPIDEEMIYNICLRTCDDGMDGTAAFPRHPQIIADKLIGGLVTLSSEHCFIVEDEEGVMGYAVAALDAKRLKQQQQMAWIPAMQEKYPKPECCTDLCPAEELMLGFHGEVVDTPECVTSMFPAVVRLDVLSDRMEDLAVTKRLLACTLSAMKESGCTGVHVELSVGDKYMLEHYRMLGFQPIKDSDLIEGTVFLGRLL